MALQVRIDGDVAVLSGLGPLMNDPRYLDAARDVRALLDVGVRDFVAEVRELRDMSGPLLGLVVTITRDIRDRGGRIALAGVHRHLKTYFESMGLEDEWESYRSVDEARRALTAETGPPAEDEDA